MIHSTGAATTSLNGPAALALLALEVAERHAIDSPGTGVAQWTIERTITNLPGQPTIIVLRRVM